MTIEDLRTQIAAALAGPFQLTLEALARRTDVEPRTLLSVLSVMAADHEVWGFQHHGKVYYELLSEGERREVVEICEGSAIHRLMQERWPDGFCTVGYRVIFPAGEFRCCDNLEWAREKARREAREIAEAQQ